MFIKGHVTYCPIVRISISFDSRFDRFLQGLLVFLSFLRVFP